MESLVLDGHSLRLEDVYQVAQDLTAERKIVLSPSARLNMQNFREKLTALLKSGQSVYGVNTGVGALKSMRLTPEQIPDFQKTLIQSHASGWGPAMPEEVSRCTLLLLANSLSQGYSGVREEIADRILLFLNSAKHPPIFRYGSVGASGDLIPMAHLVRALIEPFPPHSAPLILQEKEGLSLINNLCFTNALLCLGLKYLENLVKIGEAVGALTTEVLMGSVKPFHPLAVAPRNQPSFLQTAEFLTRLTQDSEIVKSHEQCERIQDAYSLRCQPQISGSFRFVLSTCRGILEREINATSDNPVLSADGEIWYGGNFHGELQGFAGEWMKLALAELAALSSYRTIRLLAPELNEGLPPFLSPSSGYHTGWMMAQTLQAELLASVQSMLSPAMMHKISVSGFQEDFASFSATSAAQVYEMIPLVETIVAVEMLCSADAAEYRKPLHPGRGTSLLIEWVRERISPLKPDTDLSATVEIARQLVHSGKFLKKIQQIIPVPQ